MANEVKPPHPADPDGSHDSQYAGIDRGLPPGGSTGRVITKTSGSDYDVTWAQVAITAGGTQPASSVGSLVSVLEVFDENGVSLGFLPIYDGFTP